jgi:hypothetical protein
MPLAQAEAVPAEAAKAATEAKLKIARLISPLS